MQPVQVEFLFHLAVSDCAELQCDPTYFNSLIVSSTKVKDQRLCYLINNSELLSLIKRDIRCDPFRSRGILTFEGIKWVWELGQQFGPPYEEMIELHFPNRLKD
jgi:hypothetical protein